jgi:hypothetical protein
VVLADWVDLWVCDGGYFDGVQDALSGVALHLLHAAQAGVQGLSAHQLVGSVEPSAAVGSRVRGDFAQQALPSLVWLLRQLEMLGEIGVHQHHNLPLDVLASRRLLHPPRHLPPHWKVHHPYRKYQSPPQADVYAKCSELSLV